MDGSHQRLDGLPEPTHTDGLPTADCRAVNQILSRVGDKWSVLIIMRLGDGSRRFNEIKRLIGGISQRMLTLTLRNLERDGLVKRIHAGFEGRATGERFTNLKAETEAVIKDLLSGQEK